MEINFGTFPCAVERRWFRQGVGGNCHGGNFSDVVRSDGTATDRSGEGKDRSTHRYKNNKKMFIHSVLFKSYNSLYLVGTNYHGYLTDRPGEFQDQSTQLFYFFQFLTVITSL